ncbi:MAG: parallel beta-helix repeat protein [Verrucomicrobiales bacterium]|jgi:parallel beta-helix repeat protein
MRSLVSQSQIRVIVVIAITAAAVLLGPDAGYAQSESEISFRGRGYANDDAELIELEINGQVVETFTMRDRMEIYTHTVTAPATISSLQLNYINDANFGRRHPNNRNVKVDYIEVDGQRIQSSADDTRLKGVLRGDGNRCRAEISGDSRERLDCNGYFNYGDAVGMVLTGSSAPPSAPVGDFYVSTGGNDSNSGLSPSAPFATIARAISAASPNDKILIEGGTYRQGEILVYKPVTLEAYGAGDVWVKGSLDISNGWSRAGDNWVYNGWTKDFCRGPAGDCSSFPIDYTLNPYSFHADMVFFDGTPLIEVGSVGELDSSSYDRDGYVGRFTVDQNANRIYTNIDPRGRLVESAVSEFGFKIQTGGSGSTLDGINVTHIGSSSRWSTATHAAVYIGGDKVTIRNSKIVWNASYGLFINPFTPNANVDGSGYILENNDFSHNGMNGVVVREMHDSSFVGNTFDDNNIERWNVDSASSPQDDGTTNSATLAAIKIGSHSSGLIFDGNTFTNNYSHGWWCDVGCSDITFINNIVFSNYRAGVFYEISSHAILANNIISRNGGAGLWLAESNDVTVYNNVIEDNHIANVWFFEGKRHDAVSLGFNDGFDDMAKFAADEVTFALDGIDFGNNILSNDNANGTYDVGNNNGQAVWWSDVFRADNKGESGVGSNQDTEGFNAKFDYFDCNAVYRSDSAIPRVLIEWYGEDEIDIPPPGKYNNSFSQFNQGEQNSFQANARLVQNVATNPFYVLNRTTWQFSHVNRSQLSGCRTTPVAVTNALGIAAGLNTAGLVDVG